MEEPKGKEYWYITEDEQWAIKDDAPEWAKQEFEEFFETINPTPDEDGVVIVVQKVPQKQGAFLMGENMDCKYKKIIAEHPTSGSCRMMAYCKKYKQYCFKQCKEKGRAKK